MQIKEAPYGCTETYTVRFWYESSDGFHKQGEEDLYCNSKNAHKQVQRYFLSNFANTYKNIRIISVTYN